MRSPQNFEDSIAQHRNCSVEIDKGKALTRVCIEQVLCEREASSAKGFFLAGTAVITGAAAGVEICAR